MCAVWLGLVAPAASAEPKPPQNMPASSWILVDPSSGDVLTAHEPAASSPIASATKLMTYYVASSELEPSDEITTAPYEAKPGESLAGFQAGDSVTARDAFAGLLVPSGNDAATTLALAVADSESAFVSQMNAAASQLELADTSYVDPIGISPGNVSSARDLAALATELREDPLFRRLVDTPSTTLRSAAEPLRIETRNTLLEREPFVDGVKTGTTVEAGYVLVGSGTRMGIGLISVVLGASSEESRDAATLDLLEYGFSLYSKRALVKAGERIGAVRVEGEPERLPLVAGEAVETVARADQEVQIDLERIRPVSVPIAEGEPVGRAVVRLDGRKVGEVDAVAGRTLAGLPSEPADDAGPPSWVWFALGGAVLVSAILLGLAIGVHRRE